MNRSVLRNIYTRSLNGWPLLGSPVALARQMKGENQTETAKSIIGFYTLLCGGTGFVFGLPGYTSMPVTVPANIGSVIVLQLHMTAALASAYGHDLSDEETRERCIRCVLENNDEIPANDDAWEVPKRVGVKLAERGLRYLSEQATRVVAKARRPRSLPLIGGIFGGISDGYTTRKVARAAQQMFMYVDTP